PLPGPDDMTPTVEFDLGIRPRKRDRQPQPARGRRRVQIGVLDEFRRRPDPEVEPVLTWPSTWPRPWTWRGARGYEPQERGDPCPGRAPPRRAARTRRAADPWGPRRSTTPAGPPPRRNPAAGNATRCPAAPADTTTASGPSGNRARRPRASACWRAGRAVAP